MPVPDARSSTTSPGLTTAAIADAKAASRARSARYSRCSSITRDTYGTLSLQARPLAAARLGLRRSARLRQLGDAAVLAHGRLRVRLAAPLFGFRYVTLVGVVISHGFSCCAPG